METPERRAWYAMKHRCQMPQDPAYANYGGRGITICERWLGVRGFENFLADMGSRPGPGYSLDRRDNEVGYCPENCRWSTILEQNRNKRSNVWIEFDGKRMLLSDWSKTLGIDYATLRERYLKGWPLDRLFAPARYKSDVRLR